MKSLRLPPHNCPSCYRVLTAATSATGDEMPRPGNITICFYCGHIMAFAKDMSLRSLTDAEIHDVAGNPLIIEIQANRPKSNQ